MKEDDESHPLFFDFFLIFDLA